LSLKQLTPVRLIKNAFWQQVSAAEEKGAGKEELLNILGRARAKKGMFEGDMEEGELEIGQISGLIHEIKPAAQIVHEIVTEFNEVAPALCKLRLE
jgi:enoyl-[acyl-carrier protein] reductase II